MPESAAPGPEPVDLLFTDVLAAHALSRRNHPALVDASGATSYGHLWDRSQRAAAALRALGVTRGDRVMVAMDPTTTQLEVVLGIMLAGGVACPLNVRLTAPEIARYALPLQARLVVATEGLLPLIADLDVATVLPDILFETPPDSLLPRLSDRQPALIIGTGGTTGIPKGATFSHRALWLWTSNSAHIQEMRPDDVQLYVSPFFYATIATNLLTMLHVGGTVHLLSKFDAEAVSGVLVRHKVTWLYAAPTMLLRLVNEPWASRLSGSRVRMIAYGSMKGNSNLPAQLREVFPGVRLLTGYGATEYGPVVRLKGDEVGTDPARVGRPVGGARVEVRRPDGQPAATGEPGEIFIGCPWQMDGYWGNPQQTRATLQAGMIRSGDVGSFDEDGYLHLHGRSKEAIITGGEKVWPAEVEAVLAAHPAVTDVVVLGADDEIWGERVEAAVVQRPGAQLTLEQLRAFARPQLAAYKLPRSLRLVDEIPRTTIGKVDRDALRNSGQVEIHA